MAKRFKYSRWDGTQTGFEFDADAAFDELTDELLYHGDVNAALRRMMQEGLRDRNGEQMQGLRELLEQLRDERQKRLENSDLGGVYDEIKARARRHHRRGAPRHRRTLGATPRTRATNVGPRTPAPPPRNATCAST